jgi:uncharacterized membrane protein (UPF0127 family)
MIFKTPFRVSALFCTAVLLAGLGACTYAKTFRVQRLEIVTGSGKAVRVVAEVAESDAERERGLMYRKELADGNAMVFVFDRDQILSFWMKNTLIPLSIAFIASDGRIIDILDMESQSLKSVRSSRSCRYALEVPHGWFSRAGIEVGDRLIVAALSVK